MTGEARNRLKLALRVLEAITGMRLPCPSDINELRSLAEPWQRELELDEIACAVISREIMKVEDPALYPETSRPNDGSAQHA
jgi:hypothetical protein